MAGITSQYVAINSEKTRIKAANESELIAASAFNTLLIISKFKA